MTENEKTIINPEAASQQAGEYFTYDINQREGSSNVTPSSAPSRQRVAPGLRPSTGHLLPKNRQEQT